MKKALLKDTFVEIKNTHKRFISILLIILLGAGFFAGIKAISPDMKIAADKYYDNSNFMDFKLVSTLGLTKDDVDVIKKEDYIESVMPSVSMDAIASLAKEKYIVKLSTIDETNNINKLDIVSGRLPKTDTECITESRLLELSNLKIGDTIDLSLGEDESTTVKDDETDLKPKLKNKTYTIVGTVTSPIYLSTDRGNTNLGSGKVNAFMYITPTAIDSTVYTELYVTVKNAKGYNTFSKEYENFLKYSETSLEELGKIRKDLRFNEIVGEAKQKIEDAKVELNDSKARVNKEIADAQKLLDDGKIKVQDGRKEIALNEKKANNEFSNANLKLNNAKKELSKQENEFKVQKSNAQEQLNIAQNAIVDMNSKLVILNNSINDINNKIAQNKTLINEKKSQIENINLKLTQNPINKVELLTQVDNLNNEILNLTKDSLAKEQEKAYTLTGINEINNQLVNVNSQITSSTSQIANGELLLKNARAELNANEKKLSNTKASTYKKIEEAKAKLVTSENEIAENVKKLEDEKIKANEKIADGEAKIKEANDKLASIKEPQFYVLSRDTNIAYVNYEQDSDRISKVAQVFPVIFFIVAALVSLTSMTRMVEEQRGQIGTLKALGYNKMDIAKKYLYYASIASLFGSLIGIIIGFNLLPRIVFIVYNMLYSMPAVVTEFNIKYALIAIIVSLLCTTLATFYACMKELKETPATLMRPKAPKNGKRVFLERIPFIWKRLNFTKKVTARNILRYKKRFFMTVIGIAGCTSLILAGFGLKDSISSMIPMQFNDIYNYNLQITLKDKYSDEELSKLKENVNKVDGAKLFIEAAQQSITFIKNDISKDGQMIVVKDGDNIAEGINLQDRKTKEKLKLTNDEVIITEKMAKMLGVSKGETIDLKNADDEIVTVKISSITENYVMHYIYMTEELYKKIYTQEPKYNNIFVILDDMTKDEQDIVLSKLLSENNIITSANFTNTVKGMFDDAMSSLNYVVIVLIVSAGLLAFVVLYNLSNVNISERIRELATIKVLGFYDKEVSEYVYRENILLTIIGIILGLILGYMLNSFIITTCEIDMVMFGRVIHFSSYIFSICITVVFATIVNIATHFALKKINMIESLKSVE
ncbi:MAG: FtsX-like permease family protein [Clostridia bacterium]